MDNNKELNDNLERLFSTIKDAYGIASMIKDVKGKSDKNWDGTGLIGVEIKGNVVDYKNSASIKLDDKGEPTAIAMNGKIFLPELKDKEVEEKDYEVIEAADTISNYVHPYLEKTCGVKCRIHSVKRLSDNEVFTVGDIICDEGAIKSFYISENILWVRFEEKGGVVSINDIQKVKEVQKDYEILSFRKYGDSYINNYAETTLRSNGLYLNDADQNKEGYYPLQSCIDEGWQIHSVKRLSDNEMFTIGDILHDGCIETVIISISGGNYPILKGDKGSIGLDVARKKRVPLFTTEDGKDIFEGDEVYLVGDTWIPKPYIFKRHGYIDDLTKQEGLKYFWNIGKAKEYVNHNKPCLSYNDAVHWLASDGSGYGLYEIVKEKIDNK